MWTNTAKILVVDDMKTMRLVMKKALKTLGYENIEEANDGETAWPLIEQAASGGAAFDLILSDWNMPKMQGIELLKLVRDHPKVKDTAFIMVTAESEKSQVLNAIKTGVDNYVSKPFTADTVKERMQAVYNKKFGEG